MSKDNPDENFKSVHALLRPSQLLAIIEYRKDVGTIPPNTEAIRDLVDLGLKAYWEKKNEIGRD